MSEPNTSVIPDSTSKASNTSSATKTSEISAETAKLMNLAGRGPDIETYDDEGAIGIEKYVGEDQYKKKRKAKIKDPPPLNQNDPTPVVNEDVCDCPPTFEPCGTPGILADQWDCDCGTDCEHLDQTDQRYNKDQGKYDHGTGKKAHVNLNIKIIPLSHTGELQSPIDINLSSLVVKNLPALDFSRMYSEFPDRIITVLSDTYEMIPIYLSFAPPQLSGGPFKVPYKFVKFEFLWGTADGEGCQHTIDGKAFKMELHAIHIQNEIDLETAESHANGFAIVVYFFELGDTDHPAISVLLDNFCNLDKMKSPKDQNPCLDLRCPYAASDFINTFSDSYIMYKGSLTREPYTENVTWILSPYCLQISANQLERFRSLKGAERNSNRKVQDRQNRKVNIVDRKDNIFKNTAK